ncbi:unnamed protein product, partial [Ectocarpus sp. 6 AP-2014]
EGLSALQRNEFTRNVYGLVVGGAVCLRVGGGAWIAADCAKNPCVRIVRMCGSTMPIWLIAFRLSRTS